MLVSHTPYEYTEYLQSERSAESVQSMIKVQIDVEHTHECNLHTRLKYVVLPRKVWCHTSIYGTARKRYNLNSLFVLEPSYSAWRGFES